jgi:ubiquinone/menaquinone biosynthesis C-methylase UbiE
VREAAHGQAYPPYYRQNFHYQSGGWLTAESAARYEAQVEALFSGAAGPMRRRALALLAGALRTTDQRDLVILDLACGSGAFLRDLRTTYPRAAVFGLDLSLPYLLEARRRSGAAQVLGAAERLPFADGSLDAVTCVYLFHELPPKVRVSVSKEIARVLRPGGRLAFADSVQKTDVPDVARLLDAFPAYFHEPYFQTYQTLDLPALFKEAGLATVGSDQAFLTKALLFEKA